MDLKTTDLEILKRVGESEIKKTKGLYRPPAKYSSQRAHITSRRTGSSRMVWPVSRVNGETIYVLDAAHLVFPGDTSLEILREIKSIALDLNGNAIFEISGLELIALCIINPQLIEIQDDKFYISFLGVCFNNRRPFYPYLVPFHSPCFVTDNDYTGGIAIDYMTIHQGESNKAEYQNLASRLVAQLVHRVDTAQHLNDEDEHFCKRVRWIMLYTRDFASIKGIRTNAAGYEIEGLEWTSHQDTKLYNRPEYTNFIRTSLGACLTADVIGVVQSYLEPKRVVYLCKLGEDSPFDAQGIGDPLSRFSFRFSSRASENNEPIYSTFVGVNLLFYTLGAAQLKYI